MTGSSSRQTTHNTRHTAHDTPTHNTWARTPQHAGRTWLWWGLSHRCDPPVPPAMTADCRPLKLEHVGFPTKARSQKLLLLFMYVKKKKRDKTHGKRAETTVTTNTTAPVLTAVRCYVSTNPNPGGEAVDNSQSSIDSWTEWIGAVKGTDRQD